MVSWVSVRDIDSYQLLTLSHGVGHAVHGDGLHPSGRNGAKPRVHGEHAVGEASLVRNVYFFLNRLGELAWLGKATLIEALAFSGSCMPNVTDSD